MKINMKNSMLSNVMIILITLFYFYAAPKFGETQIIRAFPNLDFSSPVDIQFPNDGSSRLFVVSQSGIIHVFNNSDDASSKSEFLNIENQVLFGGEQGLLGLAFHPNYASNGYFYINYTRNNPRRTVISRFTVSASDMNQADINSELVLLEIDQPYSNHNGGQLAFGPDGYLYISAGDGGSGGDPQNYAQNLNSLLGKILRINIDETNEGRNYSIPDDNPFQDNNENIREEIFAYGLRNVWKFSFDSNGRIWAADVGQNLREEISLIENGGNYGWRIMEGSLCYNPGNCSSEGLELPVWEYSHNSQGGYSITGGYVYEGNVLPEFNGKYIYGDFITGNIWAFDPADSTNTFIDKFSGQIAAFGIDNNMQLYFADYNSGYLYRFYDDNVSSVENNISNQYALLQNYPNPFNPSTTIKYTIQRSEISGQKSEFVNLTIYNVLGREIATLVNENQNPGNYAVEFDPTEEGLNLSSGVYFYKLRAGNFIGVRKMLLVK